MLRAGLLVTVLVTTLHGCAGNLSAADGPVPNGDRAKRQPALGSGITTTSESYSVKRSQSFDLCPFNTQEKVLVVVKTEAGWKQLLQATKTGSVDPLQWKPNYTEQILVIYYAGKRASLGYQPVLVRVEKSSASHAFDFLIKRNKPASDTFQATVVSQPCMLTLFEADLPNLTQHVIRAIDIETGAVLGQATGKEPD